MIKMKRLTTLVVITIMVLNLAAFAEESLPIIKLNGVKLKGTAISGIFEPIAIVEDVATEKNYWYKVGDKFCNGKIVEIRRGAVILDMNGRSFIFGLPEGEIPGDKITFAENSVDAALGKKTGENSWQVRMDEAVSMLGRIGSIMKEARIRPYFAIGKAAGIRVDRIKNNSIIREFGLEDGDVIKGVNGFGLMSPTKVFEAYRRYKNGRLIELQVLRFGEPVTLTYNIVS